MKTTLNLNMWLFSGNPHLLCCLSVSTDLHATFFGAFAELLNIKNDYTIKINTDVDFDCLIVVGDFNIHLYKTMDQGVVLCS